MKRQISKKIKNIIKKKYTTQRNSNGFYYNDVTTAQPQSAIFAEYSGESHMGLVEIHLKSNFNSVKVFNRLAAYTSVVGPPYSSNNNVDPNLESSKPKDSILARAARNPLKSGLPLAQLSAIVGFGVGTPIYDLVVEGHVPPHAKEFPNWVSVDEQTTMPATGGDILLHLKSGSKGRIDDIVDYIKQELADEATKIEFQPAQALGDGRNNFGFFDAGPNPLTSCNAIMDVGPMCEDYPGPASEYIYSYENLPQNMKDLIDNEIVTEQEMRDSIEAKKEAWKLKYVADLGKVSTTFIGKEDLPNANGSFAMVQMYQHNKLDEFNELEVSEQDKVFARQKKSGRFINVENPLGGDINRDFPRAHIVRAHVRATHKDIEATDVDPLVQNVPGAAVAPLQMERQGVPFTNEDGTKGLAFVAYAKSSKVFDLVLARMIGSNITWPGSEHSVDHLLDFTTAVTGQYYYIPNTAQLASLATFPIDSMVEQEGKPKPSRKWT